MPNLEGQILKGRYRIDELIGRGGMAEVYQAWDTHRQYHVAIKLMREDLAEDVEFVQRFKREAQALAALSHANIVRFYSFDREKRIAFIVMDYVEGTTLRGRILDVEGRPLPLGEVATVTQQICAALHYAHTENVLHRDIKPGNIMIQPDGRVMVTDFGIAKAADAATATTVMPGTPAYMSPEQCRSQPLDARTDVYSLGVVVYEMLAGRRPFIGDMAEIDTGSTREKIRWEQMNAEPPSLAQLNPAVTSELEAVVLKAMAKDSANRFPTVLAFLNAFNTAVGNEVTGIGPSVDPASSFAAPDQVSVPTTPPAAQPTPAQETGRPKNKAILATVAIILVLGLLIALAWFMLGQNTSITETPAVGQVVPTDTPAARSFSAHLTQAQDVYEGPGEAYAVIGQLSADTVVEVMARNERGTWWQIAYPAGPGGRGWLDADYPQIEGQDDPDRLAMVTAPPPTATSTPSATPTTTPTPVDTPTPVATVTPTSTPTSVRNLSVLPDGWAFSSNQAGNWEIYVMGDNQSRRLTDHPGYDTRPRWSFDGSKIAFYRKGKDTNNDGLITNSDNDHLWIMNADGSSPLQVTSKGDISAVWWSPNDLYLAFVVRDQDLDKDGDINLDDQLWIMNANGSSPLQVTSKGDISTVWWSPDSRHLAFEVREQDLDKDGGINRRDSLLYVVGADGSGLSLASPNMFYNDFIAWTPDGKYFVFEGKTDTDGDGQFTRRDGTALYSISSNGSDLSELGKFSGGAEVSPTGTRYLIGYDKLRVFDMQSGNMGILADMTSIRKWSPNGQLIAFIGSSNKSKSLFVADPDTSNTVKLTKDFPHSSNLVWAPDSKRIAFSVHPENTNDNSVMDARDKKAIMVIDVETGELNQLTETHEIIWFNWAPDSQHLVIQIRDQDTNGDGSVSLGDLAQLFIISADGTERVGPLLDDADFSHRWSPKGRYLTLFVRNQDTNSDGEINEQDREQFVIVSADGEQIVKPLPGEGDVQYRWSDDEEVIYVIYRSQDSNGDGLIDWQDDAELYAVNTDGFDLVPMSYPTAGYTGFWEKP